MTTRQADEAIAREHLRKHDIHKTGASMTFQEWFDENKNYLDCLSAEAALRCAWADATAAERERCARIVEDTARLPGVGWMTPIFYNSVRRETAAEIRRKP